MIRRGAQMDTAFTFTLHVRINICAFSDFLPVSHFTQLLRWSTCLKCLMSALRAVSSVFGGVNLFCLVDDSSPSLLCSDCSATKAPLIAPNSFHAQLHRKMLAYLCVWTDRSWLIYSDRPDFTSVFALFFLFFFLTVHRCVYTSPICLIQFIFFFSSNF